MAGGKYGAAVLVGQDGGLKGLNLAADAHDLLLIHADAGTQHRQLAGQVGAADGLHGLAGHLPQAFAGDQRAAVLPQGNSLGHPHHVAAHQNGEVVLRAALPQQLLQPGERHYKQPDAAGIGGQFLGQVQHLLPGTVTGVGGRGKMHCRDLQAALGHHVAGHRAINTAGEQQQGPPAGPDGDTARAGQLIGVDIGALLPDLHGNGDLGLLHLDLEVMEAGKQVPAQLPADLRAFHREGLIAALGLHLKGAGSGKLFGKVFRGGGADDRKVLFHHAALGHGHNAEYRLQAANRLIHVHALGEGLHIGGGLGMPDLEFPQRLQAAAGVFGHDIFKGAAVEAL